MRKIMLCLMFLLGMAIFAEKLTTEGKLNTKNIMGKWVNGTMEIRNDNGKLVLVTVSSDGTVDKGEMKVYKNGTFVVSNFYQMPSKKDKNLYLAWDTKLRTLVEIDRDFNIIIKYSRKLTGPAG